MKKLKDVINEPGYVIFLTRPIVNDYIPTDSLSDDPDLTDELTKYMSDQYPDREIFYRDRNFAIAEDMMIIAIYSEEFKKSFELKIIEMIKVWQYKSKITSEPWITIKQAPTQEELNEYKRYRYELRQIEVERTPDIIGYE